MKWNPDREMNVEEDFKDWPIIETDEIEFTSLSDIEECILYKGNRNEDN